VSSRGALLALAALVLAACDRPPSADGLKDWTPTDHDRAEEQSRPSSSANAGATTTPPTSPPPRAPATPGNQAPGAPAGDNVAQLVEITWEQGCAPCHGMTGHGDGPKGPMVNAPDITRDDVLGSITDDGIAAQIKNGKNRMPKFDLPDPVVRGLVARIRANRGR
jgi:cytochrome c oxidase cbb3-type subunit 3